MKTRAGQRHVSFVLRVLLTAGLMLAGVGTASGQPPITGTEVSRFSESFTDPFFCGDELYVQTLDTRGVVHVTSFEETGAYHFHEFFHGKSVNVPLDGTGPTYNATFRGSDSENIRAVRHGDVLVETDTDSFRIVAHGSDGSRVILRFHAHFTMNANGETTVEFATERFVCT
jgi:hypothetical protein